MILFLNNSQPICRDTNVLKYMPDVGKYEYKNG